MHIPGRTPLCRDYNTRESPVKRVHTLIMAGMLLAFPSLLQAEYVFLKDGSILEGTILRDGSNSITMRDADRKVRTISRKDIMRILYTELYMGKLFVQKTDGKGFVAYMVDEDRTTYTFRKKLYKPEEFTLKRDEVLFMARGNPTGLRAEAGKVEAELEWNPPYMDVKHYRIYVKGPEDKEYRMADTSGDEDYTLKDIKSNTTYTVKVTAIDRQGDESVASNEVTFTTKNIPPEAPGNLNLREHDDGSARLSWDEAFDPDTSIKKYIVHGKTIRKTIKVGETKDTFMVIDDIKKYKSLRVTAIDQLDASSGPSGRYYLFKPAYHISVIPRVMVPLGDFSALSGPGFGASTQFMQYGLVFPWITAGIDLTYYYIPGEDDIRSDGLRVDYAHMLVGTAMIGYTFKIKKLVLITPYIGGGTVYFDMNYTTMSRVTGEYTAKNLNGLEPVMNAGLQVSFNISKTLVAGISAHWGLVIESRMMHYVSGGISIGKRL